MTQESAINQDAQLVVRTPTEMRTGGLDIQGLMQSLQAASGTLDPAAAKLLFGDSLEEVSQYTRSKLASFLRAA